MQAQKTVFLNPFAEFSITLNIFWGLLQVKKQHEKMKLLTWGPKTIWHNLSRLFLLENRPTLLAMVAAVSGSNPTYFAVNR